MTNRENCLLKTLSDYFEAAGKSGEEGAAFKRDVEEPGDHEQLRAHEYEIGYDDGRGIAYKDAAERLRKAVAAIEADKQIT